MRVACALSPATSASASVQARRSADGAVSSSIWLASTVAPGSKLSASFSSSRSRRCWRSPTCRISARAASGSIWRPISRPRAITHFGSSHGFTFSAALTSPPALVTALCSPSGALARLSSRAKNATVVSGGIAAIADCSWPRSLSFHRSVPSTMMKRRPSAKVIALRAFATVSGVASSPSSSSTPPTPLSFSASARKRLRRSAIRP